MQPFSRRGSTLELRLRDNQAAVLTTLCGELIELLGPLRPKAGDGGIWDDLRILTEDAEAPTDAALARLFPDAYRHDEDASREFRHYTQADQAAVKAEAAGIVCADIADDDDGWITIAPDHVGAWLTTLTNLRLVLAERLEVRTEADTDALDELPADDPRAPLAAVFGWCGWLLETMLQTLMA